MSLLVSQAIQDANQNLRLVGQRLGDSDYLMYLHQANQYFNTTYKMPTAQSQMDLLLFPGVIEYGLPTDFLGMFQPERPYNFFSPTFIAQTETALMHYLYGNTVAMKWDHENPFLLINFDNSNVTLTDDNNDDDDGSEINEGAAGTVLINGFESLTSNGTITVGGDASSAYADGQIFTQGNGSLGFTITGATGISTISIVGQAAIDLTSYLKNGYIFLDLQSPSATALTNVQLQLISSTGNLYTMTATKRYRGNSITQGWGPIGFNFMTASVTGSPVITNIVNVLITITQPITTSGLFRLDNLFASNPVYYQLPYYSKYNVKDTNGNYIPRPLASTDTILCPPEGDQALLYKCLEIAALSGLKDDELSEYYHDELQPKEALLRSKYPKQEMRVSTNYFKRSNQF